MNKLFLILLAGILGTACASDKPQKFSGTLQLTEYAVGVRSAGRLLTVSVDEGQPVKKGQLLATLDRHEQTQKDLTRLESLYKHGGASEQLLEQARLTVEDQQVLSPVDGVVLVKIHEPGEVLPMGSPVVTLGDDRHPWVRIYVPELMVNRLRINQEAWLEFDGLRKKFKGHVIFIAPKAEFTPRNVQSYEERITQTFAVKVALDEINQGLRPGVAADVWLTLSPP